MPLRAYQETKKNIIFWSKKIEDKIETMAQSRIEPMIKALQRAGIEDDNLLNLTFAEATRVVQFYLWKYFTNVTYQFMLSAYFGLTF